MPRLRRTTIWLSLLAALAASATVLTLAWPRIETEWYLRRLESDDDQVLLEAMNQLADREGERVDRGLFALCARYRESGASQVIAQSSHEILARRGVSALPVLRDTIAAGRGVPERTQRQALRLLVSLGAEVEPALPELLGVIEDPRRSLCVRLVGLNALAAIGPEASATIPKLEALIDEDSPPSERVLQQKLFWAIEKIEGDFD